jgi:hypothetical protein
MILRRDGSWGIAMLCIILLVILPSTAGFLGRYAPRYG